MTRALVLRAHDDALRTAAKLKAIGFEPVLSPVLEVVATGAVIPAGDYDAMLASSAKGVAFAADSPVYRDLTLHVVGAKTAAAAHERGWTTDIVAGNAEAILPLLLARHTSPAHFLYLAGRDRQPTLEAGLSAAGHRVTAVNVYEARAATALSTEAVSAIAGGTLDVALHYSRRSVAIFLALAEAAGLLDKLSGMKHYALSADVAVPLGNLGLRPGIADKPDEEGLLQLLCQ